MAYYVFEFAFVAFVAVFVISQMIIPPLINKPVFWIFRKSERKKIQIERQVFDLTNEEEVADIKREINLREENLRKEDTEGEIDVVQVKQEIVDLKKQLKKAEEKLLKSS